MVARGRRPARRRRRIDPARPRARSSEAEELAPGRAGRRAPSGRRCPTPDQRRHDEAGRRRGRARRRGRPVNDVWGVGPDDALARLAAERGVPLIVMHNRAEPRYDDLVAEVVADLRRGASSAPSRAGVPRGLDLIVDPGFGFGKTADHNLELLRRPRRAARPRPADPARHVAQVDPRQVLDLPPDQRLEATLATTALGIAAGVDIVRVHDVAGERPGRPDDRRDRPRRPGEEGATA